MQNTEDYPFFSTAHETFSRTNHIWGHKASLNRHRNESGEWPHSHQLRVRCPGITQTKKRKTYVLETLSYEREKSVKDTRRWRDSRAHGWSGLILWRWPSYQSDCWKNSSTLSHIRWTNNLKVLLEYARPWRIKKWFWTVDILLEAVLNHFKLCHRVL